MQLKPFPTIKLFITTFVTLLALSLMTVSHAGGNYGKKAKKDIVDTALAAGSFNTLATALTEAGLVDTLKGDGPFTVFAPTDEAFKKIPAEQLDAILADKQLLTDILTYHVVSGKVMAKDVVNVDSATSLQGGDLAVSTDDGVKINNANVIKTDIVTSNGVIHVIDTVLVPANDAVSAN